MQIKTAVLALALGVTSAHAAKYPDKLLHFVDTGIVASFWGPAVTWLTNDVVLINEKAEPVPSSSPITENIVAFDIKTGKKITVARNALLVCWVSREKYGVAHLPGKPVVGRLVVADEQGTVLLTDKPATREDCRSRQYFEAKDFRVTDLGRGAGIIEAKWRNGKREDVTYVREDGTRIPLSYPNGSFGGSGYFDAWLKVYSVGKSEEGYLVMHEDGTVRLDTSDTPPRKFFNGPVLKRTKKGHVVHTGVSDPYNGDTFFVPTNGTPVRIYKSKGYLDQLGPDSIAPDGCGALLSMSANGPINRVLAFMNRAPQTLHYVDFCRAFPASVSDRSKTDGTEQPQG